MKRLRVICPECNSKVKLIPRKVYTFLYDHNAKPIRRYICPKCGIDNEVKAYLRNTPDNKWQVKEFHLEVK